MVTTVFTPIHWSNLLHEFCIFILSLLFEELSQSERSVIFQMAPLFLLCFSVGLRSNPGNISAFTPGIHTAVCIVLVCCKKDSAPMHILFSNFYAHCTGSSGMC